MKSQFPLQNLSLKIVLLVIVTTSSLAFIVAGLQLWGSWQKMSQETATIEESIGDLYLPMIAEAYWKQDMDQVQSLMYLVSQQPFVGQVSLIGQYDGSYTTGYNVQAEHQKQLYFEVVAQPATSVDLLLSDSSTSGTHLGTLYVIFDKQLMHQSLIAYFFNLMSIEIISLCVGAAVFLAGMIFFLSRPIRHLTAVMDDPDPRKLNKLIINPFAKTWVDSIEVDGLFRAVNKMRFSIHKHIARQSLLHRQLERYVKLLRQSNSQLKVIFDSIGDAVIVTDAKFQIEYANQNAMNVTLSKGKIIKGASFVDLITKNTESDEIVSRLADHDECDSNIRFELALNSFENQLRHYALNCAAFSGSDDQLCHVFLLTDISEQKRLFSEVEYLATHDYLTEALNRYSFEGKIGPYLTSKPERQLTRNAFAVLFYINIDHFRVVNDSVGRVAGDALLRQVAKLLMALTESEDFLARLESDVFAFVSPIQTQREAYVKADRIAAGVNGYEFFWGNQKFIVSISIGAVLLPNTAASVDSLLQFADGCCRRAKLKRIDKLEFFSSDVEHSLLGERQEIESLLRLEEAIRQKTLKLYLQPIVPILALDEDRAHVKNNYELLVRIKRENGTLLFPSEFLPSAEHYRKISLVDRYVVDALFTFIVENRDWFDQVGHIAVNLSGQSLNEEFMLDYVMAKAKSMSIQPHKLCFEVTETVAIANLQKTVSIIRAMRLKGYQFSLDDFGSGLASYSYLQQLPVNYLKIDGSFIRKICESQVDFKLVESMNSIAHHVGLKTIAEYVETKEILAEVTKLSVDYAQGYYYGKAMPIESHTVA